LKKHVALFVTMLDAAEWLDMSVKKANPRIFSNCLEVFKIHINLMSEYTKGISQLLEAAHVTSSLALLRCLIETSVNLQWISKNPQVNEMKYYEDRMPSIQNRFNQVGYQNEYKTTYVFLNKRTHGNYDSSFDCRKSSIRKLEVIPSLSYRSIQNVFLGPDGCYQIEENTPMTKQELYKNWVPFICGKSLDYIFTTLLVVFGDNVRSRKWWNKEIENILVEIISESKDDAGFLWNYQKPQTELILD